MSNGTEIPNGGCSHGSHSISLSLLPRTAHSFPFIELRQSLPSKVAAISPFVEQLMRFILKFRSADGTESDIEMALYEALANAVTHGNGENSHKRVYVGCRCYMNGEVSITVRDEGRGFHSNAVPDPTLLENLLFTHGRGIYLMKTLMDEVSFEGGGSVVRMRKNSTPAQPLKEIRMTISVTISIFGIVASIMDMPARQSPEYNLAAPTVRVARPKLFFQDTQGFSHGETELNP